MVLFFVPVLAILALIAASIVFAATWPFLRKSDGEPNRFGPPSTTASVWNAIIRGFLRGFHFNGRSNRMDFWSFAIFIGAAMFFGLTFLLGLGLYVASLNVTLNLGLAVIAVIPMMIVGAYLAVACLSMAVRRLHDVNASGWLVLLLLVFGYFILLYLFLQPSRAGAGETASAFG